MNRAIAPSFLAILFSAMTACMAGADCYELDSSVDILLRDFTHAAHASGSVKCFASNGTINFEGSFSGEVTIHQVDPSIDYNEEFSGQGELIVGEDAPAEYSTKTCYQAFIYAVSGFKRKDNQSGEVCTPDPPRHAVRLVRLRRHFVSTESYVSGDPRPQRGRHPHHFLGPERSFLD